MNKKVEQVEKYINKTYKKINNNETLSILLIINLNNIDIDLNKLINYIYNKYTIKYTINQIMAIYKAIFNINIKITNKLNFETLIEQANNNYISNKNFKYNY